jgi:hypothetical protein
LKYWGFGVLGFRAKGRIERTTSLEVLRNFIPNGSVWIITIRMDDKKPGKLPTTPTAAV